MSLLGLWSRCHQAMIISTSSSWLISVIGFLISRVPMMEFSVNKYIAVVHMETFDLCAKLVWWWATSPITSLSLKVRSVAYDLLYRTEGIVIGNGDHRHMALTDDGWHVLPDASARWYILHFITIKGFDLVGTVRRLFATVPHHSMPPTRQSGKLLAYLSLSRFLNWQRLFLVHALNWKIQPESPGARHPCSGYAASGSDTHTCDGMIQLLGKFEGKFKINFAEIAHSGRSGKIMLHKRVVSVIYNFKNQSNPHSYYHHEKFFTFLR